MKNNELIVFTMSCKYCDDKQNILVDKNRAIKLEKIKNEIIKIAHRIAKEMGIEKHEIQHSDKCYDIYILAVREYDSRKNKEV